MTFFSKKNKNAEKNVYDLLHKKPSINVNKAGLLEIFYESYKKL